MWSGGRSMLAPALMVAATASVLGCGEPWDEIVQADDPHSIDGVMDLVERDGISDVEGLLDAMPSDQFASFTLMRQTESRHLASAEHPRIIAYGPDPRFILAASSHPEDPNYEVIEMAQLDRTSGYWIYRELDFTTDPPTLSADDASCQGCHGDPARPIWRSFPSWDGAVGEFRDELTAQDVELLRTLMAVQGNSPRFRPLRFQDEGGVIEGGHFLLPSRSFGFANNALNIDLSSAVAEGIATRIRAHPDYAPLRDELFLEVLCGRTSELDLWSELGIDRANDMQIGKAIAATEPDGTSWLTGTTSLEVVVVFDLLSRAIVEEPELHDALGENAERILDLHAKWFELEGSARADWLGPGYEDDDLLVPERVTVPAGPELCEYLGV